MMIYLFGDMWNNHQHMVAVLHNQAVLHTLADVEIPVVNILHVKNLSVLADSLVNQLLLQDILVLDNQTGVDMGRVDKVVVGANQPAVLLPNQVVGELHNWTALEMSQLVVLIRKGEE